MSAFTPRFPHRSVQSGRPNGTTLKHRHGVSLLESIMAITLAVLLMSPVVAILRTSKTIYSGIQTQETTVDGVYGALRHVARQLRTADRVTAVRNQGQRVTILQFVARDGQVCSWRHDRRNRQLHFEKAGVSSLLCRNISRFDVEVFDATGGAPINAGSIRSVRCTVESAFSGSSNETRKSTCTVWIRPAT